jgi:uncharacterized protein involved in exopolysaccharide biosynthesis
VAVAFTVAFEYEQPDVAAKVAGEFITVILNEDLRNRSGQAGETTKFLAREVGRLQAEVTSADAQLNAWRTARAESAAQAVQAGTDTRQASIEQANAQLTKLKADRVVKANQLGWNHPDVQALQLRITSLERSATAPAPAAVPDADPGLESLRARHAAIQKSLDEANQKLAAARMGEALERDQQAEKFEVIEQPIVPQLPIRPNRVKLLGFGLGLALFAGLGLAIGSEALDNTIRTRSDLARIVDTHLIDPIPFVDTRRDRLWRRIKLVRTLIVLLCLIVGAAAAFYYFAPPLDVVWADLRVKLLRFSIR